MLRSKSIQSFLLRVVCLAAIVGAAPAFGAVPQHPPVDPRHVDGSSIGNAIDLTSTWLMQQGDDPRWADPSFDDSKWMVVQGGKTLGSYGLKNVDQVWYRTHVRVPPGRRDLALLVRSFGGTYTVFVNGVELGGSGPHPAGGSAESFVDARYAIPSAVISPGEVIVALRASIGRYSEGGTQHGGFTDRTAVLLGPESTLADTTSLYLLHNYTANAANISLEFLVPMIALALALSLPKEREYVALAIYGGAQVSWDSLNLWHTLSHTPYTDTFDALTSALSVVSIIGLLEFVRLVLGLRRSLALVGYEWLLGIMILPVGVWVSHVFVLGGAGFTNSFVIIVNLVAQVIILPFAVGMPVFALWVWWKRRNPDALLLFVPFFIQSLLQYWTFALFLMNRLHLIERSSLPPLPTHAFHVEWSDVANILFSVALLLFLVLRTVRIARSRAAMASDLHAVQSVQEILLARASHPTPGFFVEHVYYPASEVGGDFFLVSPGPDGSLTAVVGDVSGKGLVAAMRVSMILGVLRREEHRDPKTILRNLNDALLMQGEMGFTTACCVRMERNGNYVVANAGHISPYVGGEEVCTPASLPLGMEPNEVYVQISGFLPAGKTLVLMSDGVVEARSAKGELYGFERLPQLTMMSAGDIADVARRFGQEDDITVLTVACGA